MMVVLLLLGPHFPPRQVGPITRGSRAGLGAEAQPDGAGELRNGESYSRGPRGRQIDHPPALHEALRKGKDLCKLVRQSPKAHSYGKTLGQMLMSRRSI